MRTDKRARALSQYNGHNGNATVAHVERNIASAYPTAQQDLTGIQYGRVMSVANTSYQDGAHANKADMWAYDGELDFVLGIRGTDNVVEVNGDTVTITLNAREENEVKRVYNLKQ